MQIVERSGSDVRKLDELIRALLSHSPDVADLVNGFSDMSALGARIEARRGKRNSTEQLAAIIKRQYAGLQMSTATAANLDALQSNHAFTVTTGHQLCVLGGPSYFIYKILSTIKLARLVQAEFPNDVIVPVFWMASEDHDKEEINHAFFQGNKHTWNTDQTGAVGRFDTQGIATIVEEIWNVLPHHASSERCKEMMLRAYDSATLAHATRAWVNELLGETGLVILDADDRDLKQQFAPIMIDDLFHHSAHQAVAETSLRMRNAGWHTQVHPREINLFYLTTQSRVRIERHAHEWRTADNSMQWSEQTLREELAAFPERFSPNVILRPLYQEVLLPNLAYVGGPGELAYWMQLKGMFDAYNVDYPCLVLRDSAVVLTSSAQRKMEKLGLSIDDVFRSQSDITNELLHVQDWSIENELKSMESTYTSIADTIASIDPTLRASVMSEHQKALSGLQQVQAKARKAVKQKEETRLNQLDKLWSELYPNQQPQERIENFLTFYIQYESDLIEALLEHFNPLENKITIVSL